MVLGNIDPSRFVRSFGRKKQGREKNMLEIRNIYCFPVRIKTISNKTLRGCRFWPAAISFGHPPEKNMLEIKTFVRNPGVGFRSDMLPKTTNQFPVPSADSDFEKNISEKPLHK